MSGFEINEKCAKRGYASPCATKKVLALKNEKVAVVNEETASNAVCASTAVPTLRFLSRSEIVYEHVKICSYAGQ
jgi:hypothetical protein